MRFIADGMLGKLARWLRILGQNVDYYRAADDNKLICLAESEKRILLTRDFELYQRAVSRGLEAVFVDATNETEKLALLAKRFGLSLAVDLNVSRCPKCNGTLEAVSKDAVLDKIPKATSIHYDNFWLCTGCGQVYWQGAHWKRIQVTLEAAKSRLGLL
ncbi:MAG: hypothetical protein CW691_06055 [Candidatus Bathyarchaeum sp.]|nr:MAG: hypothetical protein CW691_06055 [Candidatus Bathyarchaeum sp.]